MKRIILNMAPYWHIVLIILVFLGIQAYCDLALPQYTSDMIDVGIQNHGVEYILPEKMTEEDMLYSTLFMTDEEKQKWEGMFTQNGELYERSASEKELENSSEDFLIPIVLTHQTGNMSEERFKSTLKESMANSPEQSPEELDIDNLTLDEISEYMHLDLKTHEDKDEKGILTTYVDMRPIMLGLISNGHSIPNR